MQMPYITRWGWICVLAAVLQFSLPSLLFTEQYEPYDVFLVQTHHKTGTALAGCLFGSLVETFDAIGESRMLYAYENRVNDTSSILLKLLQSQLVARGRPSLIFSTGSPMPRICIDGDIDVQMVKATTTNASEDAALRFCNNSMCPCFGGMGSCISTSTRCFTSLPPLRYRGVHFIREPLDIIVSDFKYHLKGSEPWLHTTNMRQVLSDMRASGVPDKYLKGLEDYAEETYNGALTRLQVVEAIVLEGLRALPDLYSMAQEHLQWQNVDWMMTAKFEDMKHSFLKTVAAILEHGHFSHTQQGQHVASSIMSRCNVWNWDSTKLLLEDHSTLNSQDADEQQLYNAILTHPFLKRHICKLNQQLGYPQRPQCVPPKAASTAGRDKGRPRRQPLLKDSPRGRHSNLQARYQSEDVHGMFH